MFKIFKEIHLIYKLIIGFSILLIFCSILAFFTFQYFFEEEQVKSTKEISYKSNLDKKFPEKKLQKEQIFLNKQKNDNIKLAADKRKKFSDHYRDQNKYVKSKWKDYALKFKHEITQPVIAIVIDDAGMSENRLKKLLRANVSPLTISFLPYAKNLNSQVSLARTSGNEIMLHLPMEPFDNKKNPGPMALTTEISNTELADRVQWNLSRFKGYVGINNHMGSKFTSDKYSIIKFMKIYKDTGLIFLDSKTSRTSIAADISRKMGIPTLERDVFLDNVYSHSEILQQLSKVEKIAHKKGFAIAIGHLQDSTIEALEKWFPVAQSKGFTLVPLSSILIIKNKQS